ncbi:MAG: succinate dehydrogenase assembly factor 2 [Hyphomicrobiales bacterium]
MTYSSGPAITSDGLDPRRKKILFRAWHRGTKEMDIVFGTFADAHIATLSVDELDVLEHLMSAPDRDLFKWISGEEPTPANYQSDVLSQIQKFHGT